MKPDDNRGVNQATGPEDGKQGVRSCVHQPMQRMQQTGLGDSSLQYRSTLSRTTLASPSMAKGIPMTIVSPHSASPLQKASP